MSIGDDSEYSSIEGYEYSGTRVRAQASRLLKRDDYEKLFKMGTSEILRFMGENEYKKEVEQIGTEVDPALAIEDALDLSLENAVKKIVKIIPEGSPIKEYMRKYDIHNIKTLLRGKVRQKPNKFIEKNFIYVGNFDKEFLVSLLNEDSIENIVKAFQGTQYYNLLKSIGNKELYEIENALDKFYYKKIFEVSGKAPILHKVVVTEIDIKNVMTVLRLKKVDVPEIKEYIVNGGGVKPNTLTKLYSKEMIEILKAVSRRKFWKYVPSGATDIGTIEMGLRKYSMLQGAHMIKTYLPSFKTVLGYIFAKEMEIANIRTIVRMKEARREEDEERLKGKLYIR